MNLKFMDQEVARELLKDHKDTISKLAEERNRFYQMQNCPHCGGNALRKQGTPDRMFHPSDPLPRYTLLCTSCDCQFDPHSGLVLRLGNLGKAWVPTIPILPGPED